MKNYEDILQDCSEECESANAHSLYNLARNMFDAVRPFIKEANYNKVAEEIKDCILRVI